MLWPAAIWWTMRNLSLLDHTETAVGTVVELLRTETVDGPIFRPVVEFVDAEGEAHRFERSVEVGQAAVPPIGRQWSVAYDPGDPSDARVVGVTFWLGPVVLGLGAIGATLVAAAVVSALRRGSRHRRAGGDLEEAGTPSPGRVEFRRVESDFGPDGRLRYRVMGVTAGGDQVYSDWIDEDPTTEMVQGRPELRVVTRHGESRLVW